MNEGVRERARGNIDWFLNERMWWNEYSERDRVLELQADIWELSGARPSCSDISRLRQQVLDGPIERVATEKPS